MHGVVDAILKAWEVGEAAASDDPKRRRGAKMVLLTFGVALLICSGLVLYFWLST